MLRFIKILFLVVIFNQSTFAQEKNEDSNRPVQKYSIENFVNQFTFDKAIKTSVGYQYWFLDKDFLDGRTLKMSVVAPHQSTHPPHKHVEDEIFFILEGTAKFYLDGETFTAVANTSFYCPSNVMHGISNVGDVELKYLVIKKYKKD
ncbi:MAG: cupin domain-containing protein [Lutibacter sp.]|nr:cupin domain-containing protein [Lutibacter sp.]